MASKTQTKGIRNLDRKSMKSTKGGIIAVLKGAVATTEPTATDLICRKAGGEQQQF
jgi:hypothetical protein